MPLARGAARRGGTGRSRRAGRLPRGVAVAVAVLLALAGTGCATVGAGLPAQARPLVTTAVSPSPSAGGTSGAAAPSPASGTPSPGVEAGVPAPADSGEGCGDPQASLRPPAVLPTPGAMPAGTFLAAIQQRGYLRAAVLADVPPFGSINPFDGQFAGFDVDLANRIGRAIFGTDGHVRFRATTYAERIPALLAGDVDIVVATMTTNCERRRQIDFSTVYWYETQRVLVPVDSPYRGLDDLGGRPVCTAAGTTSVEVLRRAASHPVPRTVPNIADCLVLLQSGRVAAITTTSAILAGMAAQDPRVRLVGPGLSDEPDAIGVARGHPELTRFVNGVLAEVLRDGTWAALVQRWLPALSPPPTVPVPRYAEDG
ncbi:glutamate ABC transporter substrate-binding protein [Frankia sp. QA3]|uniref:glutamate ABC transporter substrate-binding protein n=1 Tax=Frankia sp. QA3 TaxID=710111 RepID=UPI000269BDD1|nr:glutamate ABC transporter substrate-binding protein [Frankia sp. QA3]EIV92317.1 periplasmic component of amino acid ABC-type transporter/signal transduction system [Frankia sp. QA3]